MFHCQQIKLYFKFKNFSCKKGCCMKKKIIVIFLIVGCMSHVNYAMWGRPVAQPTSFNFSAGKANAPKYEVVDGAPKVSNQAKTSSVDININKMLADQSSRPSANNIAEPVPVGQSARNIFGLNKSIDSQAKIAESDIVQGKPLNEQTKGVVEESLFLRDPQIQLDQAQQNLVSSFNRDLYIK